MTSSPHNTSFTPLLIRKRVRKYNSHFYFKILTLRQVFKYYTNHISLANHYNLRKGEKCLWKRRNLYICLLGGMHTNKQVIKMRSIKRFTLDNLYWCVEYVAIFKCHHSKIPTTPIYCNPVNTLWHHSKIDKTYKFF